MSQIIASTYEVVGEIGSGGAGVVYLAKHKRLNKTVVLKADKRTLSAKPETLRREVDALKNLSHSYIPQVYDFIEEGGVVYTVMDYIEGESLDKPLKRGEIFHQAKVIEWACQLLQALCYLHSRPPHGILHGDIKPANVMLTPEGDIRLIDFNIALMLGEEGAVRIGFSRGYASPEHYGIEYAKRQAEDAATKLQEQSPETVLSVPGNRTGSSSGYEKKTVLLDVRSDIYSLGATLYHLLTGQKPKASAEEVSPIPAGVCSPAIISIIQKAMQPDPDLRYQTAEEMLYAFEHIRENDSRTVRFKRTTGIAVAAITAMFLLGGALSIVGSRQIGIEKDKERQQAQQAQLVAQEAQEQERLAKEQEQSEKLSIKAVNDAWSAMEEGDISAAKRLALQVLDMDSGNLAQAQYILTEALGVYDLIDGYDPCGTYQLPSEAMKVEISPSGSWLAARVSGKTLVFSNESGEKVEEFDTEFSALADAKFINDDLLAYAGDDGLTVFDMNEHRVLWTGEKATAIAISADGTRIASVYRNESKAFVYEAESGVCLYEVSFNGKYQRVLPNDGLIDPKDNLFALNGDGSMLMVSFVDGGVTIFDLGNPDNNIEFENGAEYYRFSGGFYGKYSAYSATSENDSICVILNTEDFRVLNASDKNEYHVEADENGIYISKANLLTNMYDPSLPEDRELAFPKADIKAFDIGGAYTVVVTDGSLAFYDGEAVLLEEIETTDGVDFVESAGNYVALGAADSTTVKVYKLETHANSQMLTYDREYYHTEARLSADGERIMLFSIDGFRIYSLDGQILAEVEIPDGIQLYDQQFRRENGKSYLECYYNDGLIVTYSDEDGHIISTTQGNLYNGKMYDEFLTDKLRIESPIDGTPTAYSLETGEIIKTLESDDFMTYATQVGEYIVTEYITAQGERYGLLLDENCETLARLPGLCDVLPDGTLIFDNMKGDLRSTRIYSIEELKALAKN